MIDMKEMGLLKRLEHELKIKNQSTIRDEI
jgi:hypothetical protein